MNNNIKICFATSQTPTFLKLIQFISHCRDSMLWVIGFSFYYFTCIVIAVFLIRRCFFNISINTCACPALVWLGFLLCFSLLYGVFKDMGVRTTVVNGEETETNRTMSDSIFSRQTKGCKSFMCVVDAFLLFKVYISPLPFRGWFSPKWCCFPSVPVITECREAWLCQWRIFLWKHTVRALLCGKNVDSCVFKREIGRWG